MNYRHSFHAGNFADVFKHVLLAELLRAMQRKERGFLYLDTHAGRGGYDLRAAAPGREARPPEYPAGIGRLWNETGLPAPLADYVETVRAFNRQAGAAEGELRFYPGSPWLARLRARAQDRLALWELQPEECAALRAEFARGRRVSVQAGDGYGACAACLPPPERRALVLIDPPFEAEDEFAKILESLREGRRRLPDGVFAVWYPLTARADAAAFHRALAAPPAAPAWFAEFRVTGETAALRMKGCGLLVLNPPWRFDESIRPLLPVLAEKLRADDGAGFRAEWLAREMPAGAGRA